MGKKCQSTLACAVHDLLVLGNGLEFGGNVRQIGGLLVFDGILQRLEFGVEAEAVVANLDIEAATLLDGKGDGSELIADALQHRVAGPDEGAGAVTVGS